MARNCDGCNSRMAPFFPRTNVDGELLCNTCVSRRATARTAAELHSLRYKAVNWSGNMPPSDRVFLIDQNIEPIYHLESGSHLWPRAEAEAAVGTQDRTWRSPAREIADPKDGWHPIWRAPAGQSGRWQMTNSAWGSDWDKFEGSRKVAHDSGDGETLFHCFSGDTRYVTREGIKTLAETVGTIQQVLTADHNSRAGLWVDAMIHSFGEQSLMEVTLRRNQQTKVVYATPEHRWIYRSGGRKSRYGLKTTQELKSGDRLASALPPRVEATLSPEGVRHGIVYGDGTANNGYCNVHLWGEKDKQLLPWFEMTGEASISPTMTPNGVVGVRVSAKMPAIYKAVPDTDDLDYLYGWLAGYFAADGNVTKQGNVKLDSADYGSLEAAQEIALRLGIATYDISTKLRQGYGDEPTLLHSVEFIGSTLTEDFFLIESHRDRFRFRDYKYERIGWVVDSVIETDRVEEVFCPRVPGTESFVLEGWLHTANCPFCGAGQLTGRSDGTAECGFCGTAFTVQVQPSLSTQPQTIDGEPVMMPDMPGVPGGEPGVPDEEIDADSAETNLAGDGEDNMDDLGQDPAAPTNPFQPAKKPNPFQSKLSGILDYYDVMVRRQGDEFAAFNEYGTADGVAAIERAKEIQAGQWPRVWMSGETSDAGVVDVRVVNRGSGDVFWRNGVPNPEARFAKRSTFKTASGARLSEDDYIRHLAIRYAPDRDRVIAKVRGSRKG